jgi:hypothetical protein
MADGDSEKEFSERVERSLRRGNINFDFLNPVHLPDEQKLQETDRRGETRTGKRGLFSRGWKINVMPGWYTWVWLFSALASAVGLIFVWQSDNFLALLAVPFLLSSALASLIMLGLFLARPR